MQLNKTVMSILLLSLTALCGGRGFVKLSNIAEEGDVERLWPAYSNMGVMFYEEVGVLALKQKIVLYEKQNESIIEELKILPQPEYSMVPYSFSMGKEKFTCVFLNPAIGRVRVGMFDLKGKRQSVYRGHHSSNNNYMVKYFEEKAETVVVGPFLHNYEHTLDLYDENTMNPSQSSIKKFEAFFRENPAYMLWKYDHNLEVLDSACVVNRQGVDLKESLQLQQHQVMDTDNNESIYLIYNSDNYLFRAYSSSFSLINEFRGQNDNFIQIPEKLSKGDADRLRSVAGSFSVPYALYAVDDYLVSSFYQNTKGWETPTGPYFYDIYSKTGLKQGSGTVPFPFFGRDDQGNMYLFVKTPSDSWFGDDEYYFVEISIEELLAGRVDRRFVLNKIRAVD